MNKPIIYVQRGLFHEDDNPQTAENIETFFDVHPIDLNTLFRTPDFLQTKNKINAEEFRGSLELARLLGRRYTYADALQWVPAFRDILIYPKETKFLDMAYFKKYHDFDSMPLFIRPVEPYKTFSGQVFKSNEQFNSEIAYIKQQKNLEPEYITCVYAPVSRISSEYRTIFIGNTYISGCQYMTNEELDVQPGIPQKVVDFATSIAKSGYFTNIFNFVIDIAVVNNELKLLEINAADTASYYAADTYKIYEALSTYKNKLLYEANM